MQAARKFLPFQLLCHGEFVLRSADSVKSFRQVVARERTHPRSLDTAQLWHVVASGTEEFERVNERFGTTNVLERLLGRIECRK